MDMEAVKTLIIEHEAYRKYPYRCSAGRLTIGMGRNIESKGISPNEALMLLENDIKECAEDLREIFPIFDGLSEKRQHVLIDMRFNLGASRFRGFKKMIAAVQAGDDEGVIREMKDSRWFSQVGRRAQRLIGMWADG